MQAAAHPCYEQLRPDPTPLPGLLSRTFVPPATARQAARCTPPAPRNHLAPAHLHEAVDKLVTAQCVTDDPAPLLQAAGDVLALADVLRPNATAQPFTTEAEQEIWEILLDQLHRPHRVVLARDEQEPGEVGDVGGDTGSAGRWWITATLLLPAVTRSTSRLTWAGPRCDMMTTATGPAHTRASYQVSPGRPGPPTAPPRNGGGRLPGQPTIIAQPPVTGGTGDAWPRPAAETLEVQVAGVGAHPDVQPTRATAPTTGTSSTSRSSTATGGQPRQGNQPGR